MAQQGTYQSRTVLVVDDEALIRVPVVMFLEDIGYRVLEAGDATEAMRSLEQLGHSIDVLFTDIHMPGTMDGLELAELAHRLWPHLQLVVTSGKLRISSNQVPDDGKFIPKPYDIAQLERVIQAAESCT